MDLRSRQQLLSVAALSASLLIALVFYLAAPPPRVERTLFFPGAIERTLTGEVRLVPRSGDARGELEVLVEELILGPVSIASARALPSSTEVNMVALREGVAYKDLSEEVVLEEGELNLTFDERIGAVVKSVAFNFRRIEDVVVTVGGQALYAPHYNLPESRN